MLERRIDARAHLHDGHLRALDTAMRKGPNRLASSLEDVWPAFCTTSENARLSSKPTCGPATGQDAVQTTRPRARWRPYLAGGVARHGRARLARADRNADDRGETEEPHSRPFIGARIGTR